MQVDMTGLIQEFGIDKLPEEEQDIVLARIVESVNIRVSMRISEKLSEDQMKRVAELNQSDDSDHALQEIEKMYPDFIKVYQEEVDKVREEMRTLMPTEEKIAELEAEQEQTHQEGQGQQNA